MKKTSTKLLLLLSIIFCTMIFVGCANKNENREYEMEENDMYDGPDKALEFEIERTKDLTTGKVPYDKLLLAIQQTNEAKEQLSQGHSLIDALSWIERGPNGDFTVGGNPRANNDQTAGRIRAAMIDSLDATHKTVWVGGIDGGLWKTTDITVAPANWTLVNDNLANLAVSAICQDPRPGFQNNMYFCTGESFGNGDAVRGIGVFKSTDAGATWNFLASTATYVSGTRILCDNLGNVYLGTRSTGLLRSMDGGSTWTNITASGTISVSDLELSSTGRLHVTAGISGSGGYFYTDNPTTVTSATWTSPNTPFTFSTQRVEMAVLGNVLYALPAIGSQVPTIWKSNDGGANWASTTGQPAGGWASGQAWYSLSAAINPSNTNEFICGGLDCHKTTDGGATWTKISTWVNSGTQYVHADQHNIKWWDGGNKLMFTCDGGVHYSGNGGTTIRDRNKGLRIKQFYSIAIHPTLPDAFLAGAQDNGMHRMNHPGLDSSVECVGGDGCYAAIDQDQPQFFFGSYVYNVFRRSTNTGTNWSTPVSLATDGSNGRFVNPWDYDNIQNKIYACYTAGNFLRWNDPQTGSSTDIVSVSAFGSGNVSAAHASPYTANRVYFGMGAGGAIVQVDNANTGTALTGTAITPAGATGYVNCVVTGSSDQNLMATMTNYGIQNVWVSSNGGTSWTACDGNLPDMPVRWALFHPDDNTKAFIATETGVWETDLLNGASTVWVPNTSFPNVRTDMIKYRSGDRTIAAGTHGRGIWSATVPPIGGCTPAAISTQPSATTVCVGASATFSVVATGTGPLGYQWQVNNGGGFANVGGATSATYTFTPTAGQNGYLYRCIVTGNCAPLTVTSNAVALTVNTPVSITAQPTASTICAGLNTSFSVNATGTGVSYQWQISTDGCTTYTNLSNTAPYTGTTTSTLTITGATIGLNNAGYRCVVTGACNLVNSNCAVLTVNAPPSITQHPSNLTVCAGNTASFTVVGAGGSLTYQWQENNGGGFVNIGGANAATYSFTSTLAQNTYQYRCVVSGGCAPAATSNPATLTVAAALVISSQPSNSTICTGNNTTFAVGITGTVISYQWQVSTDGGTTYNNVSNTAPYSGVTTSTLTITAATANMNAYRYRCLVTGSCPTINSNAGILTVNTAPAVTSSSVNSTICATQNTSFTIAATGTAIGYQWQESANGGTTFTNVTNGGVYTGATTATLNISGAPASMNTYQYRCVVSGTCPPAATSIASVLTVYTPVSITTQPLNVTICATGNTSFIVAAAGTTPTYQWQLSTDAGVTYNNIANSNGPVLNLTGVTLLMNGYKYRCVVSGAAPCGFVNSIGAALTVSAQPTINLVAAPYLKLLPGLTTTLTATSSIPAANATYLWSWNNNTITNSGTTQLVTVDYLGVYKVRVTDNINGCTNESATVTISDSVSSKLFIYPSPNTGKFNVAYYNQGGAATQQSLAIFDAKGSIVYNQKLNVFQAYQIHKIDLRRNGKGVYFVVIGDANGNKIKSGEVLVQ